LEVQERKANNHVSVKMDFMTLEEELADKMGNQMAHEIDREILWGMLEGMGWHRVMLPTLGDAYMAVDIITWLEDNCKSPYERNGRDFIFENAKDANWFKLRWGSI
jgi:hypothetical protein